MQQIPSTLLTGVVLLLAGLGASQKSTAPARQMASQLTRETFDYPFARKGHDVDNYHGTKVADPYRWMEDLKSPETQTWLGAENRLLESYLGGVPQRAAFRHGIRRLISDDLYGQAVKEGGRYFFTKVDASSQVRGLYVQDSADSSPRLLLDVGSQGPGQDIQLNGYSPSPDGRFIAYSSSPAQSTWWTIRVMDTATGKDVPGIALQTNRVNGNAIWKRDSKGFFYTRFTREGASEATARPVAPKVYLYSLAEKHDELVYQPPDEPGLLVGYTLTSDGRYMVISLGRGQTSSNQVLYKDLSQPAETAHLLIPEADANYTFLGNEGVRFWFYTDFKAPKGRVVVVDIAHPERNNLREVIPEGEDPIAANSSVGGNALGMFGGKFVLVYLKDGCPVLRVIDQQGHLVYEPKLPKGFIWGGFSGQQDSPEVLYQFLGLTAMNSVYRLDVDKKTNTIFHEPRANFDRDRIVVEQVFYPSKDGTRVPMFVAHKKGLKLNGKNPTFMYGYGAFGWVSFVWYQPFVLQWLEMGGVYAQPSVRGGGDYGEAWHQAGMKTNKQNAIDDYIAAAEWLISNHYTSPSRLVANGGSASGALAAEAVIQRPELFAAAVIDRPVLDMVRFDRFTQGGYWTPEFGSPDNPEEFKELYRLSPYHSLRQSTCYPPTLVMSGDHDQIAPPLHAYKFTAALQSAQGCGNPVLLKVMQGAGHNFGKTPEQTSESWGDQMTFLFRALKMDSTQDKGPM